MSDPDRTETAQEKDFDQLKQIQEYISKEHTTLNKNKYRPRSSKGISEKTGNLNAALKEFETIVAKYEDLSDTKQWNELTDRLGTVKTHHKHCILILDVSKPKERRKKKKTRTRF